MSLSFILPNQSNIFSFKRNIFTEIFSSKNVEKLARESNALIRNRKLKINKYFVSALSVLSNSPNSKIFTMQSIYDMYTSLASKENGEILTKKCVHKHLDNEEMVTCTGRMLEEVLKVISSITKQKFKKEDSS